MSRFQESPNSIVCRIEFVRHPKRLLREAGRELCGAHVPTNSLSDREEVQPGVVYSVSIWLTIKPPIIVIPQWPSQFPNLFGGGQGERAGIIGRT